LPFRTTRTGRRRRPPRAGASGPIRADHEDPAVAELRSRLTGRRTCPSRAGDRRAFGRSRSPGDAYRRARRPRRSPRPGRRVPAFWNRRAGGRGSLPGSLARREHLEQPVDGVGGAARDDHAVSFAPDAFGAHLLARWTRLGRRRRVAPPPRGGAGTLIESVSGGRGWGGRRRCSWRRRRRSRRCAA